jgi:hypothetical protein
MPRWYLAGQGSLAAGRAGNNQPLPIAPVVKSCNFYVRAWRCEPSSDDKCRVGVQRETNARNSTSPFLLQKNRALVACLMGLAHHLMLKRVL